MSMSPSSSRRVAPDECDCDDADAAAARHRRRLDQHNHNHHRSSSSSSSSSNNKNSSNSNNNSLLLLLPSQSSSSSESESSSSTQWGRQCPPPSIALFPQRHPKRSLVAIFLLLVSGARVSSILNNSNNNNNNLPMMLISSSDSSSTSDHHHHRSLLPLHHHLTTSEFASEPQPQLPKARPFLLPTAVNLVYRSHLMPDADATAGPSSIVLLPQDDSDLHRVRAEASTKAFLRQPSISETSPPAPGMMFLHGVASGDALDDSVIIWTRVSPPQNLRADDSLRQDTDSPPHHPPFVVRYDVSLSAEAFDSSLPGSPPLALGPILFSGNVVTGPEVDYTVKVELKNLKPSTAYYYQFSIVYDDAAPDGPAHQGSSSSSRHVVSSPAGATRTLPHPDDPALKSLKMAVVSCSNLPVGYFNAYANIAARPDVDVVVHLGDYFYEYQNGQYGDGTELGRVPKPDRELVTLLDYRIRHAHYKEDQDLQALHRVKPWIVIWDDHEFEDNVSGGDENAWKNSRIPAALRAYFEYLPIRESSTHTGIHRSFRFGRLLDLIMIDTRIHGRDLSGVSDAAILESEDRTILGHDQEAWLRNELEASKARGAAWRFIGNQVGFAPLDNWGLNINLDAWDGYPANRRRVLQHLVDNDIKDVVVLTGDIHTSLTFNVPFDPWNSTLYNSATGEGSILVEFIAPSITSPSPLESINMGLLNPIGERLLYTFEPHLFYADMSRRGYMLVSVDPERVTTEYWYPRSIRVRRLGDEVLGAVMETDRGSGRITRAVTF